MNLSVMVVDDSRVTRKMILRTLKLVRIPTRRIREAENGQVALEIMRMDKIDIVIADINMPVMNGLEMIETMNADPILASIPVVVVSTEGSSTRMEELRNLGVDAYIRKPFTPERVRDTLKRVVGDWEDDHREGAA